MIIRIKGKKIVLPNGVKDCSIYLENGKIIQVGNLDLPFDYEVDAGNDYVLPGYIDVHTHGAVGYDFCESDCDGILKATEHHLKCGATAIMPTVTSSTFEKTYSALEKVEKAMQSDSPYNNIVGVHLEGPYFSEKQSGAQDKSLITDPKPEDYKRLIDRFGKIIKRWDYAPERDKNGVFCDYLQSHGILPSAGHTDAKMDDLEVAKDKGCKLVTHLYSCTSTITRENGFRKLGVIECAYLWDDLYVEIIADGKHLPPELLKLIFKLKPIDKILLVSDSLKVAGSNEKYSSVGTVRCIIEDGVCKLLDRTAFAGSIATADRLVRVVVEEAGLSIEDAIKVACENPAKLFGLNKGRIEKGYDADIIIVNDKFTPIKIFRNGIEIK